MTFFSFCLILSGAIECEVSAEIKFDFDPKCW